MGERKKISLTELDESSIVASFKEEQPALAVPPTVEPETPVPRQTEQPDIKPAHESEYLRLFIHESPVCARLGKTIYCARSSTSGYSASCRPSEATGYRCSATWTMC